MAFLTLHSLTAPALHEIIKGLAENINRIISYLFNINAISRGKEHFKGQVKEGKIQ